MLINVSKGEYLEFAANGSAHRGIIVGCEKTIGVWPSVTVETAESVPPGAQLTLPGIDCGGCGLANPVDRAGRTRVVLSIPYSVIDPSTVGR
jgi:hypothetical protein